MYNFDEEINRRKSGAVKWNVPDSVLPMWVADMDFKTAPEVMEAMRERLECGDFGYAETDDAWKKAYINWWRDVHGFEIDESWILFSTGVVPTISCTVRKLTTPNENVVVLTPVYNIFFNSIVNNGCRVLESKLIFNGETYTIDYADLEEKLADSQTSLMIFCNPHNPVGKIWGREEIARVGELCKKYNVPVISDEIHCDLCNPDREYVPFASVSDDCRMNSITCIAPTKTFNLAGIQTSAVVIPNEYLRNKVNRALNTDECAEPNVFAVIAPTAAFNKGRQWHRELTEYLYLNKKEAAEYIAENIPLIKVMPSEATYLLWLDTGDAIKEKYGDEIPEKPDEKLADFLYKNIGLYLNAGSHYGDAGKGFLRMNCACTRKNLREGLKRLKEGIRLWCGKGKK